MKSIRQRLARRVRDMVNPPDFQARSLLLSGTIASRQVRSISRLRKLADAEFGVYSQWGEDGIIDWLVEQLDGIPQSFIEFGVEHYQEASTRFLLENRNWRGLIIDGSPELNDAIDAMDIVWRHDLTAVSAFITAENINTLFSDAGFAGEIGLLSIDIDGNDYWVWEAIDVVNPWIIILEYNSAFGDRLPITIPYKSDYYRTPENCGKLYFGASVEAFRQLGAKKGYKMVGGNSAGSNVFFVRDDKADAILSKIDSTALVPARFRESEDPATHGKRISPADRAAAIAARPVIDLRTKSEVPLGELEDLFTPDWLAHLSASRPPARS